MTIPEYPPMQAPRTPLITKAGVAGVVVAMLTVAGANVAGWLNTFPGVAGVAAALLAFGFELMAFVLLEHILAYRKSGDHGRLALAVVGLSLAIFMNVEGGHRGINYMAAPLQVQAEQNRLAAQEGLDDARTSFWRDNIAPIRARIAEVPPADTSGGYRNDEQENKRWNDATAEDRASLASNMARYDNMAIVAPRVEPYPSWGPYAVATVFVFFSVFGLTMFGVKVPGAELAFKPSKRSKQKVQASHEAENVIDFGTARDTRDADKRDTETVRRLKSKRYSYRRIEAETGISKSRAERLYNAK